MGDVPAGIREPGSFTPLDDLLLQEGRRPDLVTGLRFQQVRAADLFNGMAAAFTAVV